MNQKQLIEQLEKERNKPLTQDQKNIIGKDFVKNNQTFMPEQILDFYDMFLLYADFRTKRIDIKDILATAVTLGLNNKYTLVFRILKEIEEQRAKQVEEEGQITDLFDFETFINMLTEKLGNTFSEEGRFSIFKIMDLGNQNKITKDELKEIAGELRYNLNDQEASEIIQNVAGFGEEQFDFEKFNKFVARKLERRKEKLNQN